MHDINTVLDDYDPVDLRRRLEKNAYKLGPRGCWVWTGATNGDGYGRIGLIPPDGPPQIKFAAHRLSWVVNIGPIPDDLCVLHECDNRPCINPDHLFLGTKKQNSLDMVRKGRCGDNAPRLTHRSAQFIRASQIPKAQLARMFKVTRSTIIAIKDGRLWAHI